jgi:hypothetical protein
MLLRERMDLSDNFGAAGDPGDLVGGDGVDRYEKRTSG